MSAVVITIEDVREGAKLASRMVDVLAKRLSAAIQYIAVCTVGILFVSTQDDPMAALLELQRAQREELTQKLADDAAAVAAAPTLKVVEP